MAARNSAAAKPEERVVVITRTFNAPRDLVFKAWTEPHHLMRWWGPKHFTTPVFELDFRPGGAFRFCMRSPDGQDHWARGVYREIDPPERIVFTAAALEHKDGPPRLEGVTTVTFADEGGKTKITLRATAVPLSESGRGAVDGMEQGWTETIERLGEYLTKG